MTKKILLGHIVSDKMQKTVVVSVEIPKKHPIYKKSIKNTKRFKARNEMNAKLGDSVKIQESRPYSKETTWEVFEVITKKD